MLRIECPRCAGVGKAVELDATPYRQDLNVELAATAVFVPLSVADLSLVTYDDTTLPRASTTWRPL